MTIDPTTFFLEILNFLVLLWLLKRFVYQPVKASIDQRQQQLSGILSQAQLREQEAEALKAEYLRSKAQWESEKNQLHISLQQELALEREQQMVQIRESAQLEKKRVEKVAVIESAQRDQIVRQQALKMGLSLTAKLLQRLSGSVLDQSLLELLIADLQTLTDEQQQQFSLELSQHANSITVISATPLSTMQKTTLEEALAAFLKTGITCDYSVDAKLISGFRIKIGERLLKANLADELDYFEQGLLHGNF